MLEAQEIVTPIQYGYLLLAAAVILLACIAAMMYIIKEIRATATEDPDYYNYWKHIQIDNTPNHPVALWMWAQETKKLASEINKELSSRWQELKNKVQPEKTYLTIPAKEPTGSCGEIDMSNVINITFVKSLPEEPFSWHGFLLVAKYGEPTQEQIDKAKIRAASWHTCPCSELDPRIPRKDTGEPMDLELAKLGADFWVAMLMDDFWDASRIFSQLKKEEYKTLLNLITEAKSQSITRSPIPQS